MFKPIKPPDVFRRGTGAETAEGITSEQRGAEGPSGPPGTPRPGERAPHEDAGHLINDVIGDLQGAGETICQFLDGPFDSVGFKGPHRLVDGALDAQSGLARNIISLVTRWKK